MSEPSTELVSRPAIAGESLFFSLLHANPSPNLEQVRIGLAESQPLDYLRLEFARHPRSARDPSPSLNLQQITHVLCDHKAASQAIAESYDLRTAHQYRIVIAGNVLLAITLEVEQFIQRLEGQDQTRPVLLDLGATCWEERLISDAR